MLSLAGSTTRQRVRFVLAEFVVIVLGVLVALGVDEFRGERADRALELEYGHRLIADLEADSSYFAWYRGVLADKGAVLTSLLTDPEAFANVANAEVKMDLVVYSTFIGLPQVSVATFEELQTTGRVGLLQSASLRNDLGFHYAEYSRMSEILDERFGPYRERVFAALPGSLHFAARLDTEPVDPDALATGLRRLVSLPDIEEAANAELAYTASLLLNMGYAEARTSELLVQLRDLY